MQTEQNVAAVTVAGGNGEQWQLGRWSNKEG
ncbi:hypothetical protein A2U01_0097614, partial [Trifolium medium]|nr:hypothetical protein [Trifolium medium]